MKTLQDLLLQDIMPPNLLQDENIKNICEAIDPELKLITGASREALIMPRIDELDEKVIDMLAWQYHVDFYELADSLEVKRRLVKDSLKWHMKKGTRWAILHALEMLGIEAKYTNWYEFGGEPFTFKIDAAVKPEYYEHSDHEKLIENIYRAVNESKAARSTMVQLNTNIYESEILRIIYGIANGLSGYQHVYINAPEDEDLLIKYGMAQGVSGHMMILPNNPEVEFETRIYQGIITTLFSAFDVKVDYLQPVSSYQDKIYVAEAENLSGTQRVNIEIDKPEFEANNIAVQMIEADSYAVKVNAVKLPYERMCQDVWRITGEPEHELNENINMQALSVLTGQVKIQAEDY